MLIRLMFVIATMLALAGSVARADETGQLEVSVKDPDGKPLAGVQVMAWTPSDVLSGTTGSDGLWTTKAPPASYAVGVRAHARVGTEKYDVVVQAAKKTELEFELAAGITFIGRVVDSKGKPVVGASVVVEAGGTYDGYMEHTFGVPPWARDRTNASGEFFVGGIPEGKVATVVVTADGLQTTRMGIRAMEGRIHPDGVVVRMSEGASVSGTVTFPDGKPAVGASVFVIPTDLPQLIASPTIWIGGGNGSQERALRGTTNEAGQYRVEGAQLDREYLVKVQQDGYAWSAATKPVTPTADEPAVRSDVTLTRGCALSVRVAAPGGTAVTIADVRVGTNMTAPKLEEANEEGRFTFSGLDAGRTSLEVEAPGFLKVIRAVDLEEGKPLEVSITLDPGVRIRGVVRSTMGEPVASVRVSAPLEIKNPVSGWTSYANVEVKTGEDGAFELGPLPKGTYELVLYSQDWSLVGKPRVEAPTSDVELTAHRLATASLRFVHPDGSPYKGSLFVWRALASTPGSSSGSEEETDKGRLTLRAIGPEPARFSFVFDEFATIHRTLSSSDGRDFHLGDITLDPGVTVRGRVLLPSGEPAAEATVRLDQIIHVDTDADGRFTLEHVPTGPLVVSIKAEGLPRAFFALRAAASMKELVIPLIEGVSVKTHVLDADGKPVPHTRIGIDVKLNGAWHPWGSGRSDEDGRFEGKLHPGLLRFTWIKDDDEPAVTLFETEILEGSLREITLRLPKE